MTNVDLGRYKRIVQYFWDPEPTNVDGSRLPVWCLGREYAIPSILDNKSSLGVQPNDSTSDATDWNHQAENASSFENISNSFTSILASEVTSVAKPTEEGGWPVAFLDDFEARIWLTYRSNFPPIARSQDPKALSAMTFSVRLRSQLVDQVGFTSDTGWGCMIRSGQSLLANAILILRLGRDWRRGTSSQEEREILSLFADDPRAQYSIHKFVEHGAAACGKHPGEWFGPSATARCIQALSNNDKNSDLRVYMSGDGSDVYEDTFMNIAKPDGGIFKPTLVLVGTRLGIDKVTPVYWDALQASLKMPQSVGIAGGRPSSSHYFIGVQGPYYFYLDPHQTRPALPLPSNVNDYLVSDIDSCHTRRLRRIHVKEMDPSMLIAFLMRDEEDWHRWRKEVESLPGKTVIHVADNDPALFGPSGERDEAIDEVESFDDEDDEDAVTVLDD